MAGALLGKDTEQHIRANNENKSPDKKPSRLAKIGQKVMLGLLAVMTLGTLFTGATAKAAIWDLEEQITAAIVNICNPNSVPYTTDTQSWLDTSLGSAKPIKAEGLNENGNIWSTYNPQVTASGDSSSARYIRGEGLDIEIGAPNQATATAAWINYLRSGSDGNFVYPDHWSDRSSVDQKDPAWRNHFKGDGGNPAMYPVNPSADKSYYYNAPTVALQAAYSGAPQWVIHPSYTRYGFETLDWTTYGSSCYSPERYLNVIPDFLYWLLVQIPTLITFGMLRITLGGELVNIFYELVYPLTSLVGTIITPWVALIAIVIGLPFVWIKSKGSIQKILSGAAWIAAMLFAISQLTQHAEAFTNFSQGLVVKVSGTFACTIANQAYAEDAGTIKIGGDAIKDEQYVPVYDEDGNVKVDGDGNTVWQTRAEADKLIKKAAEDGAEDGSGDVTLTLDDLKGISNDANTACGSYLDGIYNAYWQGVPLQVWAEGQVGAQQAARDRTSEGNGKIGWYQAFLNSMYVNPNDIVGEAQIQSTTRWNDAGYTDLDEGKPMQWNIDGHADGNEGDIEMGKPINVLEAQGDDRTATMWKTVPFLLNVKFLCKDDSTGAIEHGGANGADNASDYAANKWLYDGTCITAGDSGILNGLTGYNLIDRIGLSLVGGWLAMVIFVFTVFGCIYIGYQKFVWGFMLMFAPIFLGIAAFPDEKRMNFARKYLEFCLSNVLKQIMAVMILVTTVTALGKVVFPSSDAVGGESFFIPWMLKPFVAIMFLVAAALFAIPMKRIMVGAVKGDASVVDKTAKMPADAAKAVGGAALAVGAIAATGGLGSGALLGAAGKAASMAGMRQGGLTGALASVAGREMSGKGASIEASNAAAAAEHGIAPSTGGLMSSLKRDRALKKATGTKALSQKAALEANAKAQERGEALPYATDKNNNLTKAAQKQAKSDFVGAQKGQFWKSPEFTSDIRNKNANAASLASIKDSLTPEFTDKDGNVDHKGLDAAASAHLSEMNNNSMARHTEIGKNLLAEDQKRAVGERKYLDANGKLDPSGQSTLFRDIRAIDGQDVGINNTAAAHQLMSANPEHYNEFVSEDNPNGNFTQALKDANIQNYGTEGSIGSTVGRGGFAAGNEFQQIEGSKAYLTSSAPVVGTEGMSEVQAATTVQDLGGSIGSNSPEVQTAFQNYSDVLSNSDSDTATIESAHINALESVYNTSGLTEATSSVQSQVISPVTERGVNMSPEAVRQVSTGLPESSGAVRQTLDNYASAIEEHGSSSDQARHAFDDVRTAVEHEDRGVYSSVAASLPMPSSIGSTIPDRVDDRPVNRPADPPPSTPISDSGSSAPAPMPPVEPRRAAEDDSAPRRAADPADYSSEPPRDYEPRRAMDDSPEPRRATEDSSYGLSDVDSHRPADDYSDPAPRRAVEEPPAPLNSPSYDDDPAPRRAVEEPPAPLNSPSYDDDPAPRRAAEEPPAPLNSPSYDDDPAPRRAVEDSLPGHTEGQNPSSGWGDGPRPAPVVAPVPVPRDEPEVRPEEEDVPEAPAPQEENWSDEAVVMAARDREASVKSSGRERLTQAMRKLAADHKKATNHRNKLNGLLQKRNAEGKSDMSEKIKTKISELDRNIEDIEREMRSLDAKLKDMN